MKHKSYKTLSELLQKSPILGRLSKKTLQIRRLEKILYEKLHPNLAKNCRIANLRNGTLILATTSPTWNHQLRFIKLELLSKIRNLPEWRHIKSIEHKVIYLPEDLADHRLPLEKPKQISSYNAELIKQIASTINSKSLANSLTKLAKHSAMQAQPLLSADEGKQ